MKNLKILIIGMLFIAILLVGCTENSSAPESEMDFEETVEPEGQDGSDNELELSIDEWSIKPTRLSASAGLVRLVVSNKGNIYHEFMVEGTDFSAEIPDGVQSGETRVLEIDLAPGRYNLHDPIPGRDEKGMTSTLVVE